MLAVGYNFNLHLKSVHFRVRSFIDYRIVYFIINVSNNFYIPHSRSEYSIRNVYRN